MINLLCAQDLWEFVTIGYLEPADQEAELDLRNAEHVLFKENRKEDNKSLGLISKA